MLGTYAAVVAVCAASLALGQAALALCGARRWSWLSPAVGLALLLAVCWGTVRLPGDGLVSAIVVPLLVLVAVVYLWGRLEGGAEALRAGWPVALGALLAASLPFAVEGHFGILGTGFNPDMSQHLLATERLAEGQTSELLRQGYPLGPHAVVVALEKGLGIGLVHGFSGLTVAVAVIAPLTALAAFARLRPLPRTAAALVVGLTYMVASYFAQGAFKETIEALFLLAFVLALRESGRAWSGLQLRLVPAGLIAVGAVYAYSFPGLIWLAGAFLIWALAKAVVARRPPGRDALFGALVFAVLVAPELGRMVDFKQFETFDPDGPGLGNLFGQVSPLEALGIWPSGDFRVAPGDGAAPAALYYLGAAFGLALLAFGVARLWARRELAILSGLAAAVLAYLAARGGGTPYTAAKAIEIAAPLVALSILTPLLWVENALLPAYRAEVRSQREGGVERGGRWVPGALGVFMVAAGFCSILALANAPVGPSSYSQELNRMRSLVGADSTLVLARDGLLADEQGEPYLLWELRGGRVCVVAESAASGTLPRGVRFVVTEGGAADPPYPGLRVRREAPPYVLWEATGPVAAESECPLIAVRQARQGDGR